MAEHAAVDIDALLKRQAEERRADRAEDFDRQTRSDKLIADALGERSADLPRDADTSKDRPNTGS